MCLYTPILPAEDLQQRQNRGLWDRRREGLSLTDPWRGLQEARRGRPVVDLCRIAWHLFLIDPREQRGGMRLGQPPQQGASAAAHVQHPVRGPQAQARQRLAGGRLDVESPPGVILGASCAYLATTSCSAGPPERRSKALMPFILRPPPPRHE
jgi:hypothetical protein